MKILAIDTATEACSAALWLDGQVKERFVEQPRGHGKLILGMMDELLREAGMALVDLDALAFGRGPGAFTGVRIAVAVAQGVGFGANLPLLPVSNLAALAQRLYREQQADRILPALDARIHEIYIGAYEIKLGLAQPLMEEQVIRPERLSIPPGGGWHGVGRGWTAQGTALQARLMDHLVAVTPELLCTARDMLPLAVTALAEGRVVDPMMALPLYLRNQVASPPSPSEGRVGSGRTP